jgi:putative redox protein
METEVAVHAVHEGGMRVRTSDGQFDNLMDYPMKSGDWVAGPTPLTMLLASLAACSLNSVMVVLKKMQQPLNGLEVNARATRSTTHPTVLNKISLEFIVKGDGVDAGAIERALQVSEERLCPVWNMLKASTPIHAEFHIQRSETTCSSAM